MDYNLHSARLVMSPFSHGELTYFFKSLFKITECLFFIKLSRFYTYWKSTLRHTIYILYILIYLYIHTIRRGKNTTKVFSISAAIFRPYFVFTFLKPVMLESSSRSREQCVCARSNTSIHVPVR